MFLMIFAWKSTDGCYVSENIHVVHAFDGYPWFIGFIHLPRALNGWWINPWISLPLHRSAEKPFWTTFKNKIKSGVGKICSLDRICSRSTAFSVWEIDLGFFASCRYWPNLAYTANPGPVICQGWPEEPVKLFRCSWFIPPLEVLH